MLVGGFAVLWPLTPRRWLNATYKSVDGCADNTLGRIVAATPTWLVAGMEAMFAGFTFLSIPLLR